MCKSQTIPQKYGIYGDFVNQLNKGAKKVAQLICEKGLPSWLFKREAYAKHVPICARVFHNKNQVEDNKNAKGKDKEKEKKIQKKVLI